MGWGLVTKVFCDVEIAKYNINIFYVELVYPFLHVCPEGGMFLWGVWGIDVQDSQTGGASPSYGEEGCMAW